MSLWLGKLLLVLVIYLQYCDVLGLSMRFTNITCESTDLGMGTMEYCEVNSLGKNKNSIRLRYRWLQPAFNNIGFHLQLMTRSSQSTKGAPSWQPFLYSLNLDMCRFWKNRYNHLARLLFGALEGHTNLNHSCPYSEKFIAIDDITNLDISRKLRGIPLAKGFYSVLTRWSMQNQTRAEIIIYFEVFS